VLKQMGISTPPPKKKPYKAFNKSRNLCQLKA
jgi:hypothetical protein